MVKIDQKMNRRLIILLSSVVLIAMTFIIFYQYGELRKAREDVTREKEALTQVKQQITDLVQVKEQTEQKQAEKRWYERLIPNLPKEDQLIREVQFRVDTSGLTCKEIRFGNRIDKEGYIEMPISIVCEGRYSELIACLKGMTLLGRALRIDSLKVSKLTPESPVLRVEMMAAAFYASKK
ncbi:type 4a pilus biogenesis protein PilO [Heliobacillus mobilis]|uniref:Type 4a pilus biogenesis protein PilO n=1 Tax=Heliobacterium mobile TaxID=28064 RepID=A0A6I3SKV5_HELMO|nr:type 4a pilus biogenesis protein PilO [Heliobacterium mobile]MTV49385.1 type 4a pilus biogenesis protein PilO [Heliobacterium mobile]